MTPRGVHGDPQQFVDYVIIMCLHILNLLQLFYYTIREISSSCRNCTKMCNKYACVDLSEISEKHVQNTKQITENLSF